MFCALDGMFLDAPAAAFTTTRKKHWLDHAPTHTSTNKPNAIAYNIPARRSEHPQYGINAQLAYSRMQSTF